MGHGTTRPPEMGSPDCRRDHSITQVLVGPRHRKYAGGETRRRLVARREPAERRALGGRRGRMDAIRGAGGRRVTTEGANGRDSRPGRSVGSHGTGEWAADAAPEASCRENAQRSTTSRCPTASSSLSRSSSSPRHAKVGRVRRPAARRRARRRHRGERQPALRRFPRHRRLLEAPAPLRPLRHPRRRARPARRHRRPSPGRPTRA